MLSDDRFVNVKINKLEIEGWWNLSNTPVFGTD